VRPWDPANVADSAAIHTQMLEGCVCVRRQKQNHRLLWVQIRFTHSRAVGPDNEMIEVQPERTLNFRIE